MLFTLIVPLNSSPSIGLIVIYIFVNDNLRFTIQIKESNTIGIFPLFWGKLTLSLDNEYVSFP